MFAAFDNRFLNFKRLELVGAIKGRGFQMEPYISDRAMVSPGAKIGENSFIADGAIIGSQARLQYNNYVGPRAVIGHACETGHSVWVDAAVVVGARSTIGAQSILGAGVSIAGGIQVGKMCLIEAAGHYSENIPAKSLYKSPFEGAVRIFN
jgi:UDP-3-O-[3-hydroxymyristoyl] glucosamine N-acyltransferase